MGSRQGNNKREEHLAFLLSSNFNLYLPHAGDHLSLPMQPGEPVGQTGLARTGTQDI